MDRVPELYRLIIDDVLRSIKLSLEQYGWDEETVARKTQKLQQKWEDKINRNGCLDPSNSPLLRQLSSVPSKAEKRKMDRALAREAKKQAKLSKNQAVHGPVTTEADANANGEAGEDGTTTRTRAPLSYPVLNPRAASEQQLLLAQLSQQQAPVPALAVSASSSSSAAAATTTSSTIAPASSSSSSSSAPSTSDTPATIVNPFEQPVGDGKKKVVRKPTQPKPLMGPGSMASFTANPADFNAAVAAQQAIAMQQMQMQYYQQAAAAAAAASSSSATSSTPSNIPQQDGAADDPNEPLPSTNGDGNENEAAAAAASSSQSAAASSTGAAASFDIPTDAPLDPEAEQIIAVPSNLTRPDLGPSDDDSDDDAAMAVESEDLVLCQFEKVAHLKDRWKVVLKDGIIRVNKRDFVFSRAAGEFEW